MENLNEFIKKLSYEMELEEPLKAEMKGFYTLPLGDGVTVAISKGELGLSFFSEICKCPTLKREEFLTELMHANLFGQGTSDAILGLTTKGDKITLRRDLAHEVDYQEFSDILEDFINTIDYWIREASAIKS